MGKFKLAFGWILTEDGYLISLIRGDNVYKLNEVGRIILSQLLGGKSENEICEYISEKFEVPLEIVRRDFEIFLKKLCELGAIEVTENE